MSLQRAIVVVLCAVLPAIAAAEGDCGSMMRNVTRFRGTVRSINPLGGRSITITPIDLDPKFVVSVVIRRVDKDNPALKVGETRHFAVHSPSRIFGTEQVVGKAVDLEAEWMTCEGVFWRFMKLRKASAVVEDYTDWLAVGHTYRAKVKKDGELVELVKPLRMPMHYGGGVWWENLDAFPQLTRDDATRSVVFEVMNEEIRHRGEYQWSSRYTLRIVSVSAE